MNRLPGEEAFEIIRQSHGRVIPTRGLFLEAFQANRFQVARDGRIEQTRTHGLRLGDLSQRLTDRVGAKGGPAC